jgi:hypothetical protein
VVSGNMVIVMNDAGRISAFRTSPIGSSMAAPHGVPAESGTTPAPAPEPAPPPTVTPQPQ